MKRCIRIMAILMALLMLGLSAVACAENNDDIPADTTTASAGADTTAAAADTTTAAPEATDQYDVDDTLPADLKFDGEVVRIISRDSDGVRDEISVSDYSGEPINDAIYERNLAVEARLGIDIENTMLTGGNYVVTEEIRRLVLSGEDSYDMLANSTYSTIMYTSEGLFRDLNEVEYLDLTQIYWSQGFNDVASFGTKQFMCAGALGLTLYRYMFVTMFNKDMMQARGLDNLYDVVNDGKWTLDYHASLAAQMYEDMNGNGEHDENDKYGFISGPVAYVDPYWSSCKLPILAKDNDNRYVYSFDNERMATAVENLINKSAAEKDNKMMADVTAKINATPTTLPATPAPADGAAPAAKPAAAPPFDIAKFAGIFAAIGMAVGMIGTALVSLAKGLWALTWWQLVLVFLGLMMLISGPAMVLAWLKLRRRNIAPLLNANGWAVNAASKISIPFGETLTDVAKYPKMRLKDPYAKKECLLGQRYW